MPSKKKKYNARFPPARIKKIMQTDEDVGKVAAAVPVIISRALELFIESLIVKSAENTKSKNAKTLSATHIKQTITSEKKFDFLKDLVANIPDIQQVEEEASDSVDEVQPGPSAIKPTPKKSSDPSQPPKKRGRPKKIRDGDDKGKTPVKQKRLNVPKALSEDEGEESENEKTESDHVDSDMEEEESIQSTHTSPVTMKLNVEPSGSDRSQPMYVPSTIPFAQGMPGPSYQSALNQPGSVLPFTQGASYLPSTMPKMEDVSSEEKPDVSSHSTDPQNCVVVDKAVNEENAKDGNIGFTSPSSKQDTASTYGSSIEFAGERESGMQVGVSSAMTHGSSTEYSGARDSGMQGSVSSTPPYGPSGDGSFVITSPSGTNMNNVVKSTHNLPFLSPPQVRNSSLLSASTATLVSPGNENQIEKVTSLPPSRMSCQENVAQVLGNPKSIPTDPKTTFSQKPVYHIPENYAKLSSETVHPYTISPPKSNVINVPHALTDNAHHHHPNNSGTAQYSNSRIEKQEPGLIPENLKSEMKHNLNYEQSDPHLSSQVDRNLHIGKMKFAQEYKKINPIKNEVFLDPRSSAAPYSVPKPCLSVNNSGFMLPPTNAHANSLTLHTDVARTDAAPWSPTKAGVLDLSVPKDNKVKVNDIGLDKFNSPSQSKPQYGGSINESNILLKDKIKQEINSRQLKSLSDTRNHNNESESDRNLVKGINKVTNEKDKQLESKKDDSVSSGPYSTPPTIPGMMGYPQMIGMSYPMVPGLSPYPMNVIPPYTGPTQFGIPSGMMPPYGPPHHAPTAAATPGYYLPFPGHPMGGFPPSVTSANSPHKSTMYSNNISNNDHSKS